MKVGKLLIMIIFLCELAFAQIDKEFVLIARNTGEKLLADGNVVRSFGFAERLSQNPPIPGPTLIVNEGDSVQIDLYNISQGAPHTIHLHGLDVDQQNDGVPHLSFTVHHQERGSYYFEAPHAGTYLYHCHVVSTIHVQAGMYGLIIVKSKSNQNESWEGGHHFDSEQSFMTSEIDTFWHHDSVLLHDHDTSQMIQRVKLPKYKPQFYLINGFSDSQFQTENVTVDLKRNEVKYLRFANIGFFGNLIVFPEEFNAQIISSDGRPLPTIQESDSLWIFPGERYGVLVKSEIEFIDGISFSFVNVNTMKIENTQLIPAKVDGELSNPAEIGEELITIYPNPSDQNIFYKINQGKTIKLTIRTMTGTQVEYLEISKTDPDFQSGDLDITHLQPGIYFFDFLIDGEKRITKKLMVY